MPRWKALPDELDPEIREFASQMRQLVDRGGLSLATVSDRTGYSKTSWERYLNGRLLPPQGAVSALAEVTGTDVRHLATMWELAERAWSRAEMRHDMTMEAIRISQAREALAQVADEGKGKKRVRGGDKPPKRKSEKPRFGKAGKPDDDDDPVAAPRAHGSSAAPPAPPAGLSRSTGSERGATPGEWSGAPQGTGDATDRAPWPKLTRTSSTVDGPGSASEPARPRAESTVRIPRVTGAGGSASAGKAEGHDREADESADADATKPSATAETAASRSGTSSEQRPPSDAAPSESEQSPLSLGKTGPADLRKRPGRPEWPADWPTPMDSEFGDRPKDAEVEDALPSTLDRGREEPTRPEWSARLSGVPATPPRGFESTTVLRKQTPGGSGGQPASPYASAPGGFGAGSGPAVPPGPPAPPTGGAGKPASKGRRVGMLLAGAVGALAVVGGAVFFLDIGGQSTAKPAPSTSPSAEDPKLPDGVKCSGADCTGEDPELMGCGGQYAETTSDAVVGNAYVEIRYSEVCEAAWARVSNATPGSGVTIESAGESEREEVADSTGGYTKMVASKTAEAARACVETTGGMTGCTSPAAS